MSEGVPNIEPTAVEVPVEVNPKQSQYNVAFRMLEGVSLVEIFHRRECVIPFCPTFC